MESKEWFEEWFDTAYYHTLYQNRNEEEASDFVANLLKFLNLQNNSRVLDLACGKGRHSLTLNSHGYNVMGVDLSSNSISLAKEHEKDSLQFAVHDMRNVIAGEKFKAVFNLFTSFGYFDNLCDNECVVSSIHEMLEENGALIIDFMNSTKVINHLVKEEIKVIDGIKFHLERNYDGGHIFKNIRFEDNNQQFHYTERVQALDKKAFMHLLEQNKFEIISTFGDFSLNPFDEETSDRLIIIAKKI